MKKNYFSVGLAFVAVLGLLLLAGAAFAQEQKVVKWRMVSTWPKTLKYLAGPDIRFTELVKKMSNGRLDISFYGAGELCPAMEVLNMVSAGTVQAGGDWAAYWAGKNTAFDLLGSHQMGFCADDYLVWILHGGGLELYQELYGKYNCMYLPHTVSYMESGIRTNKPVKTMADLKGMKIRMVGLVPPKLLEAFGGIPVNIAVPDLYEALRRGTLDGAEYSVPINDKEFHIEEITKYWLTPGFHQTSSVYGVIVNKSAFNALPADLKAIVQSAANDTLVWGTTRYAYADAGATEYLKTKVTINRLSVAELDQIEVVKNKIQEELAGKNPDYAKVLKSQIAYFKMFAPYRDAVGDFGFGRNPKSYPEIK